MSEDFLGLFGSETETAAIALLDRRAGVARAFPLRFRSGECGERSDQHAGERLWLILAAVRASRHSNIRQPHATDRVASRRRATRAARPGQAFQRHDSGAEA
jgi:hypothetical protein